MSDFLTNLLMRHQGQVEVVRPRLPGMFEPWGLGGTHTPLEAPDAPYGARKVSPETASRSERGSKKPPLALTADAEGTSSVTPAPRRAAEEIHSHVPTPSRLEANALKRGPDPEKLVMSADILAPSRKHSLSAMSAPSAPVTQEKHPGLREQIPRDEKLAPKRDEIPAVLSGDLHLAEKEMHHPEAAAPQSEAVSSDERSEIPAEVAARLRETFYLERGATPGDRAAPTVRVTIGRVEVRAVETPSKTPPSTEVQKRGPSLSLDEYLSKRNGES